MSISLGLYDLFANAVPGLLYLYVLNEFGRLLGFPGLDFSKIENTAQVLGVVLVSFLLGHVFNAITYRFWFKLWVRRDSRALALKKMQIRYPEKQFDFDKDDADLLIAFIQHHDLKISEKIETARVSAIMMRNVSFGFFLLGLLSGARLLIEGVTPPSLAVLIGSLIFSGFALYRAADYDKWFYRDIFKEALVYGNNYQEVLGAFRARNGVSKPDEKPVKVAKKKSTEHAK
jgi:hypothetical protein